MSKFRRTAAFLTVFLLLWGLCGAESGTDRSAADGSDKGEEKKEETVLKETEPAEAGETAPEEREPAEAGETAQKELKDGEYPTVIDRWNDPEAYPDFAFSPEEDLLEIWFPRIRDRDAAILLYQGECWMIDCSDIQAEERVAPLLEALKIQRVDKMFNTHPHHDHLDGLEAVDQVCPVMELAICFPEDLNETMIRAVGYADSHFIRITRYDDEQVFCMGDGLVRLKCWLKVSEDKGLNDRSAQMMVSYGNRDILFMADIEREGQKELLEALDPSELDADILRYPHHGKQALVQGLLEAVSPELAVITSAEKVSESRESAKFLTARQVPIAYTASGHLHLVTDGETWLAEKAEGDWLPVFNLRNER